MSQIRIGIDVGGTFTHAVAIDNRTLEIAGYSVTPTTHRAAEGVARGVVDVFVKLLDSVKEKGLSAEDVVFVAHSTTQATNALLEGDVAPVGICAAGAGVEGMKAKMDADIPAIEITEGKFIATSFSFIDLSKDWEKELEIALAALVAKGSRSLVAAEAFSVDDPSRELAIKEAAEKAGLPACGTHEMSGLYGLRVRTRTAVINASILPRMMETANMTGSSLSEASIKAPLMIMRSDGGVMSIDEMKRRPLLTLLSGPAAGIAAALTYIRATDAIFLEVGGTSTDMSVIRNGRAVIRSAQVGGHQTYMKTLDSRTLGIAGGSLVQLRDHSILEVGPRSAHIAGLPYVAFTPPESLEGALEVSTVTPLQGDPAYLVISTDRGEKYAVTTTCAANFLGYIKEGDYAHGIKESLARVFEVLGAFLGLPPEKAAQTILDRAVEKILPTLNALIDDYELKDRKIRLIGGGGGSSAIVPYLAEKQKIDYEIASHAEIISAIGAALAMVRETIEKNIFNAKPEDIEQIRQEAEKSVLKMGASPDSIDVHIEVDGQKNIVRAIATGSMEFRSGDLLVSDIGPEGRVKIITETFGIEPAHILQRDGTEYLHIYELQKTEKYLLNLFTRVKRSVIVMDGKGTVKLQVPDGHVAVMSKDSSLQELRRLLEAHRTYGDAGSAVPSLYLVFGRKILDLSSVLEEEQILSLAGTELDKAAGDEKIMAIVKKQ